MIVRYKYKLPLYAGFFVILT